MKKIYIRLTVFCLLLLCLYINAESSGNTAAGGIKNVSLSENNISLTVRDSAGNSVAETAVRKYPGAASVEITCQNTESGKQYVIFVTTTEADNISVPDKTNLFQIMQTTGGTDGASFSFRTGKMKDGQSYFVYLAGNGNAGFTERTLIASFEYYETEESGTLPGDTTGDGKINNRDVSLLQQYLSGWNVVISLDGADVTADGKVNSRDTILLQRYLSGWNVTLGPAKMRMDASTDTGITLFSASSSTPWNTSPGNQGKSVLSASGGTVRIVAENVSTEPGKEVTANIIFENNPGLISYRFGILYDPDKLELLRVEDGDFPNVPAPIENNPYIFNWADGIHPDSTGRLVGKMTFRVKDGTSGKAILSFIVPDPDDFCNAADETVPYETVHGEIDIVSGFPGVSIQDITVNSNRVSITVAGSPETDVKLFAAVYEADGKFADIASCHIDTAGKYDLPIHTAYAKKVSAFLIDIDGKPVCAKRDMIIP